MLNTHSILNKTKSVRKKLFIYPGFQLKLLIFNLFIMIAVAAAIAFFIHRSFIDLRGQGVTAHLPPENPYFAFMGYQEKLVMNYLAIGLTIASILSSLGILILSHRLAGPIVRLSSYLTRVEYEPWTINQPLAFRKGDFFSDLPAKVNGALKACNGFRNE